jgi:hypothetical protein
MGTRLSVYGWAFQFGGEPPRHAREAWINVCVRCGSGAAEVWLRHCGAVSRAMGGMEIYACPQCGGLNLLTRER